MNLTARLDRLEAAMNHRDESPWLVLDLGGDGNVEGPKPSDDEIERIANVTERLRPGFRVIGWEGSLDASLAVVEAAAKRDQGHGRG